MKILYGIISGSGVLAYLILLIPMLVFKPAFAENDNPDEKKKSGGVTKFLVNAVLVLVLGYMLYLFAQALADPVGFFIEYFL